MEFAERFWSKVDKSGDCWNWTGAKTKTGYGVINKGRKNLFYAHRLSWEMHNKKELGKLHALHKCDNPSCVNPEHLISGTHSDNMKDMFSKGRRSLAEDNSLTKLTNNQVKIIKELREKGLTYKDIATEVGVDTHNVKNIFSLDYYSSVEVVFSKEKSLIAWMERSLEVDSSRQQLGREVGTFKKMWIKEYGSLDNVPQYLKSSVQEAYNVRRIEGNPKYRKRRSDIWEPCNLYYKLYKEKKSPAIV